MHPLGSSQAERASGRRTTPWLWALAGLLLVAVIALALMRAWPVLHPTPIRVAEPDPTCDLRLGPCEARFPGRGSVRFAIEPRTIPVVTPLRLTVATTGIEVSAAEVDFVGIDMNMGYNRVALTEAGSGLYEGRGTLPVCVRQRMDWEARVLLHTPEGMLAAPFGFATYR